MNLNLQVIFPRNIKCVFLNKKILGKVYLRYAVFHQKTGWHRHKNIDTFPSACIAVIFFYWKMLKEESWCINETKKKFIQACTDSEQNSPKHRGWDRKHSRPLFFIRKLTLSHWKLKKEKNMKTLCIGKDSYLRTIDSIGYRISSD